MTINEVVNLDCREDENNEIIQKYLKKIKPLSKYKDSEIIPFYKIEKVITILTKKYKMRVKEFTPDVWSNVDNVIWRSNIINDNDLHILCIVYGLSLYEVLAKTAIYMYSVRDKVKEREV